MPSQLHLALQVLAFAAATAHAAAATAPPPARVAPPAASRPLGKLPPLETFQGTLHLWHGDGHSPPAATVVVDNPSQLFLVLSNLPELGPPFPAGWGDEAVVTVTGRKWAAGADSCAPWPAACGGSQHHPWHPAGGMR
ncbi:hypothetical protein ABPG75_006053 [Micractinium tetrahymenae]